MRASIPDSRRQTDAENLYKNVIAAMDSGLRRNDEGWQVIGTYYPHGHEIHPTHEIEGYRMALPVIRDKTTLEFYEWKEGEKVIKRDFDIPIPDFRGKEPVTPDIILMPLVLCDRYGNRIGQGAGHYDRYIASLDKRPFLIGLCFDEQVYEEGIPAESHDVMLDLIITPKHIIEVNSSP